MEIRKAKPKDVEGIYEVLLDMFEAEDKASKKVSNEYFKDIRKKRKDFKTNAKKAILEDIKKKNSLYLVAEEDKILGYAYGSINKRELNYLVLPKICTLHAICVSKSARGKKVSSRLKKEMIKWFKKNKCEYIYLDVFTTNPAKKVYKKWGFKPVIETMYKKI